MVKKLTINGGDMKFLFTAVIVIANILIIIPRHASADPQGGLYYEHGEEGTAFDAFNQIESEVRELPVITREIPNSLSDIFLTSVLPPAVLPLIRVHVFPVLQHKKGEKVP